MSSRGGKLFRLRLSPGIFLLLGSYLCTRVIYEDSLVYRVVHPELGNLMFFLLSWVFPLIAIPISCYQLIRHRALQYVLEIAVALWLLVRAFDGIVRASS